jgi:hypothetical protein
MIGLVRLYLCVCTWQRECWQLLHVRSTLQGAAHLTIPANPPLFVSSLSLLLIALRSAPAQNTLGWDELIIATLPAAGHLRGDSSASYWLRQYTRGSRQLRTRQAASPSAAKPP